MPHDHRTADTSATGAANAVDERLDATSADVPLDVRTLPHAQRHTTIFSLLPRLELGQALVLSVDHDPQPLRYQLEALHPGDFAWEYLERGPELWRIALRRTADVG